MADSTISQLPPATSVSAADLIPVDQGGVTKRATLALLGNGSVFVTAGKSLTVTNTLIFTGTDGTTITFPATSATMARTDAGQTFTGTQVFGVLTCTTINGGTLAFVAAKTLTINNTITFTGTDGTTITLPATDATMARTDAAQSFTGTQTFAGQIISTLATGTAPFSVSSTTPVTNLYAALNAALAGSDSQVFSAAAATAAAHAVRADQIQGQSVTAFTTGGSSTAYTLTPTPAITSLVAGQRFRVSFHTTAGATPTLAISGLTAKSLKIYDPSGVKQDAGASSIIANMLSDVEYDGTDYVLLDQLPPSGITTAPTKLPSFTCTEASNALTISMVSQYMDFRSTTLTTGTPITISTGMPTDLVIPATSNLGHPVSGVSQRYAILLQYNAGTPVLCAVNLAGGLQLDETNLISPTTIGAASSSSSTIYSAEACSASQPYVVLGIFDAVFTTGTGWTAVSLVQPGVKLIGSRSRVKLRGRNGFGSSSTKIRRLTTIVENVGYAITYADSATLGMSCTVNVSGMYGISATDTSSAASYSSVGLSLNTSEPTTNIASITAADQLTLSGAAADTPASCAWVGWLNAGDVVRLHTGGTTGTSVETMFEMAYLSSGV